MRHGAAPLLHHFGGDYCGHGLVSSTFFRSTKAVTSAPDDNQLRIVE